MSLRLATAIALILGLAGPAAAQFALPGQSQGSRYQTPQAVVAEDDEPGVADAAPIQSEPLPPPGGRMAAPGPEALPGPGADSRYPAPAGPVELTAPGRPQPAMGASTAAVQPAPPATAYPNAMMPEGVRPPAEIEEAATGSVAAPMQNAAPVPGAMPGNEAIPAAPSGNVIAALPPEDQPEIGAPKELPPHLRRQLVEYWTKEPAGTIIVDTPNTYLYLVLGEGKAMRYGIGVGREGFTWSGVEKITKLAEWPDWYPPGEMIERQPYLPRFMAGGESNPLGARALYLGKTVYRIHGTNQPSTIGTFVSSGCIRLTNEDIQDLYQRVKVGTKVVVLPSLPNHPPASAANSPLPASPLTAATPATAFQPAAAGALTEHVRR
ncbi:MAG TPA: L,D-transpeptidase family protein [Xanthobacteraceae bacterium]|nr:L,D-transpeptidase family protein [Xanthobacteraceae bacterium]